MAHPISDQIELADASERASLKVAAFAARQAPDSMTVDTGMMTGGAVVVEGEGDPVPTGVRVVSIIDGPYDVGGVLQFSVGLEVDSIPVDTSSINPIRVVNPPLLIPDPNGDIERVSIDPVTKLPVSTFYREDLDQVLLQIAYDVTSKL